MDLPGIGRTTFDESTRSYVSDPVPATAVRGAVGRLIVAEDAVADGLPDSLLDAVTAFVSSEDALWAASEDVFHYYTDTVRMLGESGSEGRLPHVEHPVSVWDHVTVGKEFCVERDRDGTVYVSVECECTWEPEHGLQLVFLEGRTVSKVGPFDGHLTNRGALGRDDLDGVVYVSPFSA